MGAIMVLNNDLSALFPELHDDWNKAQNDPEYVKRLAAILKSNNEKTKLKRYEL